MFRFSAMLLFAALASADEGTEFFEKKIRPLLAEKCYACHSAKSKMAMGGLQLDSAAALRKGGDSGPAVVPGDPAKSRLMEAVRYASLRIKMPPAGKLPDEQIADFERWIAMGAPDPRTDAAPPAAVPATAGIDIEKGRQFWSFQPVKPVVVPAVRERAWVKTPVDAFVLAKLEAKDWKPAERTDKRSWIRRVTFDLTGLPPSPAEIDAYLKDTSAEAERHVVDRLLASPHYGERWARHWLDLMRFAETNGHEFDNDKLDAWRYRDYVIRAFNEDVPYNQIVQEHIAGDLLPSPRKSADGAHLESPLGTGAYWFGEVLNSATDSVKSRADMVDNQIDVFGKAFLGLTVACARCHDHKFDPIPTRDYYALAGVMHSTYVREAVVDSPERTAAIRKVHENIGRINQDIARLAPAVERKPARITLRDGDQVFEDFEGQSHGDWYATGQAFGPSPVRSVAPNQVLANYGGEGIASSFGFGSDRLTGSLTSKKFKMPKLWVHVRMGGTKGERGIKEQAPLRLTVVADDHKSEHFLAKGGAGLEWVTMRMTKEIGRICYIEIVDRSRTGHIVIDKIVFSNHDKPPVEEPGTTGVAKLEDLVPHEQKGKLAALQAERAKWEEQLPESAFGLISMEVQPQDVKLHIRGSHENLGEPVPRGFLRLITANHTKPITQGSGRLEVAEWIASDRNPLTARVLVNRVWKHHFGAGLVRSADNFGKMGEAPVHGELLDWLAAEFVKENWSSKHLHRLMVLSSTYAMSSQPSLEAAREDPRNTLLHHMPVRRLEAEAIRDSMLAISGRLDPKLFGPGVTPHISKYQDGRGKPQSGPLDGNGRRSIYVQVRRNFLTPMFLAFDYPLPVSTIGARGSSTVPSQALLMMNNELVSDLAASWAKKTIIEDDKPESRIDKLYAAAFGRPPEEWERRETLAYVSKRSSDAGEAMAWTDLCHVLLNSAEFLYVR